MKNPIPCLLYSSHAWVVVLALLNLNLNSKEKENSALCEIHFQNPHFWVVLLLPGNITDLTD